MATTTVTPTAMSLNTAVAITQGAGTAIVAANTLSIATKRAGELLIIIDSDHADTAATFAAGDFASAGIGSLEIAVGNGVSSMFVLDCSRFTDDDGNVTATFATNSAGYIRAYYMP